MRNHNEKIKDMIESVLPSAGRKAARDDRSNIHRRERTHTRSMGRAIPYLADADDVVAMGLASELQAPYHHP